MLRIYDYNIDGSAIVIDRILVHDTGYISEVTTDRISVRLSNREIDRIYFWLSGSIGYF